MAGSRHQKIGDIFSRTTGLLRSGAMKPGDKPMWYDIYQAFPPLVTPTYERVKPSTEIKQIFYPEDKIRAKFYRKYGSPGIINLNERHKQQRPNFCSAFVAAYQAAEAAEKDLSEEDLMLRAEQALETQGLYLDRSKRPNKASTAESLLEDDSDATRSIIRAPDLPEDMLKKINLEDIFATGREEPKSADAAGSVKGMPEGHQAGASQGNNVNS